MTKLATSRVLPARIDRLYKKKLLPEPTLKALHDLMWQVCRLSEKAGQTILSVYHQSPDTWEVDQKADRSPVTIADKLAHEMIVEGLTSLSPSVPILSEEAAIPAYEDRQQWDCYWLVDPLDGTKEFLHRTDEFTVNIALIMGHQPVLGVVQVPVKQETFGGIPGDGAYICEAGREVSLSTRPLPTADSRVLTSQKQATQPVLVTSRRHGVASINTLIESLTHYTGPFSISQVGSSLKFCLIAKGSADIYPRLAPTAEWDTAAGQALVEAAGGQVVDVNFKPLSYNTRDGLINPHFLVLGDPTFDWKRIWNHDVDQTSFS